MKNLKKLSGILLAIAVLLACTVTAFAESGTSANNDGSITITNAKKGETYTVYKMLELESFNTEPAPGAYTYKIVNNWENFFKSEPASNYFQISNDTNKYVTLKQGASIADDTEAAENLAKAALTYAKDGANGVSYVQQQTVNADTPESRLEFTGLPLGYYVVDSTVGTLCNLKTTNKAVEITDKNYLPSIDKYIVDGGDVAENTAHVGETINYKIVVHAKKGAIGYQVVDTCDSSITLSQDAPVVKVGDVEVSDSNYTWTRRDDQNFTIVFKDEYLENNITGDTDIVITYSARLNSTAATVSEANKNQNKATLKFNETSTNETAQAIVTTKTYKFDLVKTTNAGKLLDGATFKLYTQQTDGEPVALIKVNDTVYRIPDDGEHGTVTDIVVEGGKVEIRGLEPNTYWLAETVAPNGYNILLDRKSITIGANDEIASVMGDTYTSGGLQVINETGSLLPSTGGIGTTIFYIVGGVLVAAAVVLLVAKKRTSENR